MIENYKIVCMERRCGWHGMFSDLLSAPHPFHEGAMMHACPKCKESSYHIACMHEGCWEPYVMGTPTPDGYKFLCHEHGKDLI